MTMRVLLRITAIACFAVAAVFEAFTANHSWWLVAVYALVAIFWTVTSNLS